MGGNLGVCIGAMLGGVIPHTVGGHMGRKSMLLLHSGCITPLTHRQTHLAFVLVALTDAPINTAHSNNFRIAPPLSLRRFLHPFDISAIRHILGHRCVLPAPARRGHHRDRISSMMRRLPDAFNISLRTGASATGWAGPIFPDYRVSRNRYPAPGEPAPRSIPRPHLSETTKISSKKSHTIIFVS